MAQGTVLDLMHAYEHSGVIYNEDFSGFNWGAALPFKDDWSALPLGST
jgi:hypothetical protein